MHGQDPRFINGGYTTQFGMGMEYPHAGQFGYTRPQHIANYSAYPAHLGWQTQDLTLIQQQLNEVKYTLSMLTDLLRTDLAQRTSQNIGMNYAQMGGTFQALNATTNSVLNFPYGLRANGIVNNEVVRLRESETNLFCEIFLSNLTVGEIELETIGNRIVCRTRVPVALNLRQLFTAGSLPRHFEVFEVPDGRLEFSWTCPVQFHGKDVEATYREGYICINAVHLTLGTVEAEG